MFSEIINNKKSTPNFFSPHTTSTKFLDKIKYNSRNNKTKFPKLISKSNNATKKSSLKGSINVLYKSLFPEEKTNLDSFIEKYLDKSLKRPLWKYSLKTERHDDIIRKELMKKNRMMKSYEYLRQPTKLKLFENRKPNMVKIIEDNYSYKYKFILYPWEEEYNSYIKNKNKNSLNKNSLKLIKDIVE